MNFSIVIKYLARNDSRISSSGSSIEFINADANDLPGMGILKYCKLQ